MAHTRAMADVCNADVDVPQLVLTSFGTRLTLVFALAATSPDVRGRLVATTPVG